MSPIELIKAQEHLGYTVKELAEWLGVSESLCKKMRSGSTPVQPWTARLIRMYLAALDVIEYSKRAPVAQRDQRLFKALERATK